MFQELTKEMKEFNGGKNLRQENTLPASFRGLYNALSKPNSA